MFCVTIKVSTVTDATHSPAEEVGSADTIKCLKDRFKWTLLLNNPARQ
jgi:hypothetical protein